MMMKKRNWLALALAGTLSLSLLAGCSSTAAGSEDTASDDTGALAIADQGIFSAGGTVITSDGTFDVSNYYTSRAGSTSHVDHANVLYQIPEEATGLPMVFLHGYGQSRMGWMTTPDGREGWSDMFLRMGHSVWLVDQPRRGLYCGRAGRGHLRDHPGGAVHLGRPELERRGQPRQPRA